jgi:arginine/ornithine N-succinyltransferase beta subunit
MVTVNVFVRSRVLVDAYCPIWMSLMEDNFSIRFIPARVLCTPVPAHIPFLGEKTGFRVG